MLDIVEVRTPLGALLSLPLEDPTNGYFVEEIEGLDPVKASLVSVGYAQGDGAQYRGGRIDPRNIKFRIALEPDYISQSMDSLRQQLYSFFMPKSTVNLRFRVTQVQGGPERVRDISGVVEDCAIDFFSETCVANISVMCYDPYFSDPTPVTKSGTLGDSFVIENPGTVPVGFRFDVTNEPQGYGYNLDQRLVSGPPLTSFNIYGEFRRYDIIKMNSEFGKKSLIADRVDQISPVPMLGAIQPGSQWLQMGLGRNLIQTGNQGVLRPFTLRFTPKYGGL